MSDIHHHAAHHDHASHGSSTDNNPWFIATVGLGGLIVGYLLNAAF